jgi:serine/threonine protein phosphatase PrpC
LPPGSRLDADYPEYGVLIPCRNTADRLSNPDSCAKAIADSNQNLYALMEQDVAGLGMGTTLVGAFLTPNALLTFNVGDSAATCSPQVN